MPDISRYEQFGRFPAIEMPVTDGQFQFFDLNKRCLSNEWNDILRIYVGIVEEKNEEPEEDAEEEKPLDPFDKVEEAIEYAYGIKTDQHKYILLENDLPDNY